MRFSNRGRFLGLLLLLYTSTTLASNVLSCVANQYQEMPTPKLDLPDPSLPGSYDFKLLRYGEEPSAFSLTSLFNLKNPEFISSSISLPKFLANYSKKMKYSDDAYHDFKRNPVPLNGKMWLPNSLKPLPLIVLTHGNSDPGFDYLGELFASRGHVVVQIDQTYLNGLWGENGARAWVILKHIQQLSVWNRLSGHALYNRIDLSSIALIGMSRGGEAVAHAASFNQLKTIPQTNTPTQFGFNIKSVVALAPMDGQYHHDHGKNTLKNVNYMVLQGGHDADVYQFLGTNQWHRTQVSNSNNLSKYAIYIYRANHINFNQDMSDDFQFGKSKDFYQKLLSPAQQEKLTQVLVSAFIEKTLHNKHDYDRILERPQSGLFGLPQDIYISRFANSTFIPIEDFESTHFTSASVRQIENKSAAPSPTNIIVEQLRNGTPTENHVLKVHLKQHTKTQVQVKLPKSQLALLAQQQATNVHFSMARTDVSANCSPYNLLDNATLTIRDEKQNALFSVNLANAGTLAPKLSSDYTELESENVKFGATEPLLQTFTVPVTLNTETKPISDLELVFEFVATQPVAITLDDIAISHL